MSIFALVHQAATEAGVSEALSVADPIFCGYIPINEIVDHIIGPFLDLEGTSILFFITSVLAYSPTNNRIRLILSTTLPAFAVFIFPIIDLVR